jgi:protein SCO1/2
MKRMLVLLYFLMAAMPASASLTRAELDTVAVALRPGARLNSDWKAPDTSGHSQSLRKWQDGKPAFFLPIDYTCNTLCATDLELLANAVQRARLAPSSYRIIVFGIDPKDSPASARDLEQRTLPTDLRSNAIFLLPDAATIKKVTDEIGFHYSYDSEADQFAHPAVVYTVAPDGVVRNALSSFALQTADLRAVLNRPKPAGFIERLRAFCYGYAPASGLFSGSILTILRVAGIATLFLLAGGLLLLARRTRRSA